MLSTFIVPFTASHLSEDRRSVGRAAASPNAHLVISIVPFTVESENSSNRTSGTVMAITDWRQALRPPKAPLQKLPSNMPVKCLGTGFSSILSTPSRMDTAGFLSPSG